MTEIPEHLLKRSKERRAALTGQPVEADAPAAAASGSAEVVAPAAAAAPARPAPQQPAVPPPPKPDIPVVAAAKARKKIPYWAVAGLALLPIWGFMYARALTPAPKVASGPLGVGAVVYGSCASCHGSGGEGGSGRVLNNGEVLKTFPRIEDQINFVYWGTQGYEAANIAQYGDPNRAGGAHTPRSFNGTAMPGWGEGAGGALTDAQILAVVCHERFNISGEAVTSPQFTKWCAEDSAIYNGLADGSLTLASPELADVGTTARPSLADQTVPAGG
jgi:mono/diheme cytochrome c family protein